MLFPARSKLSAKAVCTEVQMRRRLQGWDQDLKKSLDFIGVSTLGTPSRAHFASFGTAWDQPVADASGTASADDDVWALVVWSQQF